MIKQQAWLGLHDVLIDLRVMFNQMYVFNFIVYMTINYVLVSVNIYVFVSVEQKKMKNKCLSLT